MENTCIKCNEKKDVSLFVKDKRLKIGFQNKCKICSSLDAKKWHELNKDYKKEYQHKYRKDNYKSVCLSVKERVNFYNKNNPIKYLENYNKANSTRIIKITNSYIINILNRKGFTKEQITPELIEVQRIIIKTKRLCKTSKI